MLDDEPTWAMQLALRIEKDAPPRHQALCEAAAMAVLALLTDDRTRADGDWREPVLDWEARHIRKVARRARGTRWTALDAFPGVLVDHDGAQARAFVPGPVDELPPEIVKLQVGGTDLPRDDDPKPPPPAPYALISLNPDVVMTTGKAAAQCGHAAQLLLRAVGPWPGLRVHVVTPKSWPVARDVEVHDGGFTEVAPGTNTAVARLVRDDAPPA